jgi:alcohol dehydrogenase class IV
MGSRPNYWKFAMAGEFVFGRGCLEAAATFCERSNIGRVLIVADKNLAAAGLLKRLLDSLSLSNIQYQVFDEGEAEPSLLVLDKAVALGKQFQPEAIIGFGGGSNIDVAKATALILRHGGHLSDYFGFDKVPGPVLPLIAIPTTAGTGSEVSHSAVLTDPVAKIKVSTLSGHLRPRLAVVDPSLTDSCPAHVTAHSGIDALVHAIEGYTARRWSDMHLADPQARAYEGSHPLGQLLALEAIRLIGKNLQIAVHEPSNQNARDAMALAASYAGMAFSNCGVALVHALEYPLGATVHCSHGEGNGLLLPHVLEYNLPTRIPEIAEIGKALGAVEASASVSDQAQQTIIAIRDLQKLIGIRQRLRELGVQLSNLPDMAHKSFQIKRLMDLNPRSPSESDLLAILTAAY